MRRWLERQMARGSIRVMTFGTGFLDPNRGAPPDAMPRSGGMDPRHEIRQDGGDTGER